MDDFKDYSSLSLFSKDGNTIELPVIGDDGKLDDFFRNSKWDKKPSDNLRTLKIRNKLPQIIVPMNKIDMFLDWYNSDLRFQDEVPHSFDEGYLVLENDFIQVDWNSQGMKDSIKSTASNMETTYRNIENFLKTRIDQLSNLIVYFKFFDKVLELYMYGRNELLTTMRIDCGVTDSSKPNPSLARHLDENLLSSSDELPKVMIYYCFIMLSTSLWYLATTTKTTKYFYTVDRIPSEIKEKHKVNTKRERIISTPIYDMNKIKRVPVEKLVKRREGWTYSHSFIVHRTL